jgi:hypothetical protein
MLLRRITKHVKDQNWFAVGIDFCIVVVGVFIGLQVANWNEARGAIALEENYLSLLARDLSAIELTLTEQVAHEDAVTNSAANVLLSINNRTNEPDPVATGQALMRLWGRRTLTLESPTFSELKNAGRLSIIRDDALRNRLMSYFDGLARTERLTEKNNDFFVEAYTAFLRDSGIGFVSAPSDECEHSNDSVLCAYNRLLASTMKGQKTGGADVVLSASPDDPIWISLRSQVSFRTIAAISNRSTALGALEETKAIASMLPGAER